MRFNSMTFVTLTVLGLAACRPADQMGASEAANSYPGQFINANIYSSKTDQIVLATTQNTLFKKYDVDQANTVNPTCALPSSKNGYYEFAVKLLPNPKGNNSKYIRVKLLDKLPANAGSNGGSLCGIGGQGYLYVSENPTDPRMSHVFPTTTNDANLLQTAFRTQLIQSKQSSARTATAAQPAQLPTDNYPKAAVKSPAKPMGINYQLKITALNCADGDKTLDISFDSVSGAFRGTKGRFEIENGVIANNNGYSNYVYSAKVNFIEKDVENPTRTPANKSSRTLRVEFPRVQGQEFRVIFDDVNFTGHCSVEYR